MATQARPCEAEPSCFRIRDHRSLFPQLVDVVCLRKRGLARYSVQHGIVRIDRGGAVRFRLLVIDGGQSGRIIAAADGVRPARDRDSPDRQALLPVRETDLADQLWKVEVDYHTGPTLLINSTIYGLGSKLREHALLQGLVFPHALRTILRELASGQADEDDDIWRNDWRTFLESLEVPAEPDDADDSDAVDTWIESAVEAFCANKNFAGRARLDGPKPGEDRA
jgi:hypothetical protein